MRIGCIGSDPLLQRRVAVLQGEPGFLGQVDEASGLDLLFIGVPASERFEAAAATLRLGAHVFLEWPPSASIRECWRLASLSEEAGLETAVSRPLRAGILNLPQAWRARVVSMEISSSQLTTSLADAIDLCFALVRNSSVRRVEAEAAYDPSRMPSSVAVSIRFYSGAFAQVFIRLSGGPTAFRVYAAGSGGELERELRIDEAVVRRETCAVVQALGAGKPVPVSAMEALQTLRVIERVMALLR